MTGARPLLIVNPSSGKMAGGRWLARFAAAVERVLGDVDFELTARRGHATDLARRAAGEGRETIVAVGGDGTLNEVVNGVMQARQAAGGAGAPAPPAPGSPAPTAGGPRVGVIGLGTGGDFGGSLGIGGRLDDYLGVLAGGRTRAIDLLRVGFPDHAGEACERYVVNVLSAGPGGLVDRYVEKIPRRAGGRLSYGLAAVWALAQCPRARLRLRLAGLAGHEPGEVVEREVSTYLLGLCNGAVFGGGMRLAPTAVPDDGLLDVVSIATDSKWTVVCNLPKVYRGRHLSVPGVELMRCRGIEVELLDSSAAARFALDLDGEPLGRLPLRAELLPAALAMLAPAPTAAPEA
ncbi:MAG: diacylglycerol kinase family protein [Thermoleophilia bacterium]